MLILKNQSPYFRQVLKGREDSQIDIQKIMLLNNEDLRRVFDVYDVNKNGKIEFEELKQLFVDLSFDKQYSDYADPEGAFYHFLG